MEYRSVRDIDIKNQIVLVRVDYNVPLENGKIADDFRIRASLPTLEFLRQQGAKKIILISHLGRPDGKKDEKLSLENVAKALAAMLPDVHFTSSVSGPDVELAAQNLKDGGILLLENLRFYPGEEANSEEFIRDIINSTGATIYVQDGFAVSHRKHASVDAITKCLPVYAGLLYEKEIVNLTKVIENPDRPLLLILGGAKVTDKQPLIDKFLQVADQIVVGGKIAADGYTSNNSKIYVAEDFDEDSAGAKLDIGPLSTVKIADYIKDAKTIVWNGLLGKAEDPAYATASTIVAELLGEKTDATTVICGGDTTAFVNSVVAEHPSLQYSLVSTGGGAALELFTQ